MKVFMLELINTAYGFELRTEFLKRMTSLLKTNRARLCIDEIMTAGRASDTFLLSDDLDLEADYITLGKFMTQGVVLERKGLNPPQTHEARVVVGISLGPSLSRMAEVLQEV